MSVISGLRVRVVENKRQYNFALCRKQCNQVQFLCSLRWSPSHFLGSVKLAIFGISVDVLVHIEKSAYYRVHPGRDA